MCVIKLGVSKLCVSKLGLREAAGGGEGGRRECTTKNKNPTQRCGEKHSQFHCLKNPAKNSRPWCENKVSFCYLNNPLSTVVTAADTDDPTSVAVHGPSSWTACTPQEQQ